MTYKIVSKYIKDLSFKIPEAKSYFLLEKNIRNYRIKVDVTSKKLKENIIEIDAEKGSLKVLLSNKELIKRKKKWRPRKIEYNSGTLWKYSQSVGPAIKGAVTHPGAYKAKKSYADI